MTTFGEIIKYVYFENKTDLPLQISSWIDGSHEMETIRIGPKESTIVHSSVGEWHMDSMFNNEKDRKRWIDKGLEDHLIIGKFHSQPCILGNYAWMEYDEPFYCVFTQNEGEPKGRITFMYLSTAT